VERPGVAPAAPPRPVGVWRVVFLYALVSLAAFPFPETLFEGRDAMHQALDVFDDGAVSRLGGLAQDWRQHGWVWWNEHVTNGNAYFTQFMGTPLSVESFLAFALGPYAGYLLRLYMAVLAAGLAMHLFLRRSLGLAPVDAGAASLVYLLGFWHFNYGFTIALAPLVFWISDEAADAAPSRRRWLLVASAFLCGFLFYNLSSQAAVFLGGLHLAWVIGTTAPGARRSGLAFWATTWVAGLALYAPVLVPQLAILGESVRSIRSDAGEIASLGAILSGFVDLYLPVLVGTPAAAGLGVSPTLSERGTWYVGAAAVGLLLWSLPRSRASRRERLLLLLLAAVPAFDLIVRPIWLAFQDRIGILRSLQPRRLNLYMPFLLAANLGVAVAMARRAATARPAGALLPRRLSIALAAVGIVQTLLAARMLVYNVRRGDFWEGVGPAWILAVAYAAFGAATIWLFGRGPASPAGSDQLSRVVLLLLGVFALDRVLYARVDRYLRPAELASFRQALGETPAIAFLRAQGKNSGRVVTIGDYSRPNRIDHANRMMFFGLRASDGYQNIYPLRYHELFGVLIDPALARRPVRRRYYETWGQRAYLFGPEFNRAIASLLGVRWLYVRGVDVDRTGLRLAFQQGDEAIFENPEALPRVFLAGGTRIAPSREALLASLGKAGLSEIRSTVFLAKSDAAGLAESPDRAVEGRVLLQEDSPDRLRVEVDSPEPAWLVLTDAYFRGWEAAVDGRPATIVPAYGALRAVAIPAGQSVAVFSYEPKDVWRGAAIAAAALALLLIATVVPRRARVAAVAREAA
jgi:hypothetical protein